MSTLSVNPTLSTVLFQLLQERGITESELARAIQLPRATINRIKLGKITNPTSSTLTAIATYFNITIDQLLGHAPFITHAQQDTIIQIPILSWAAAAGNQLSNNIDIKTIETTTYEDKDNDIPKALFALRVMGDAMWPYFDDNSIIIVNKSAVPQNRNFVVAYIAANDEVILRQLLIDNKSQVLISINSAFKPITLNPHDSIIGVVIHAKKTF